MEQYKGQNIIDFMKAFPDDVSCKRYLAYLKWHDGFECSKCGHHSGHRRKEHSYFCYKCQHVESATAGTLFHKVKFGLQKAFCIAFEMSTSSKGVSSIQMGKRFGIRQGTAWFFMQKVRKAMESSQKWPLSELVHIDEFVVGGQEEGKKGRSYNTKKTKVIVGVELNEKRGIKRAYAQVIDDYSAKSFTPFFERHISKKASVVTDKWTGYNPLKQVYDITQVPSNNGKNFKKLHLVIHQIKSWIRTIPTHASKHHMDRYLNEFSFRLNRSQFKQSIFHKTIERMLKHKPYSHSQIIENLSV